MSPADLSAEIRLVIRTQLPLIESPTVDRLTSALVDRLLARESAFADRSVPVDRDELLDRLTRERHTPIPERRLLAASLPNLDTPEVVATRLNLLREIPVSDLDDPVPARLHPTCIDVTRFSRPPASEFVCGPDCPDGGDR